MTVLKVSGHCSVDILYHVKLGNGVETGHHASFTYHFCLNLCHMHSDMHNIAMMFFNLSVHFNFSISFIDQCIYFKFATLILCIKLSCIT